MKLAIGFSLLLVLAQNAAAYQRETPIAWVTSVVAAVISEFSAFVHYTGPAAEYRLQTPKPRPTSIPNPSAYWLADIKHQGVAPYAAEQPYQVFRNVKDFGAKGDGITDDTAAINSAISSGGRCAPHLCASTTKTPAVVYFPPGTYLLSSSIVDYYFTQLIGNPNSLPILKATVNFNGFGLIDGNQYGANGLGWGATNVFFRQIRNFVFDITDIPVSSAASAVHWPTAQATSLQNCLFLMSDAPGTQHQGLFIEDGSGGYLGDLVFRGGNNAAVFGNQQFTVRNLTISNAVTAISQLWDWGWTYKNINIYNCSIGLNVGSVGDNGKQNVGSITFIDSTITNTPIGVVSSHDATSQPPTAGSLIIENLKLNNVSVAVQGVGASTLLAGSSGASTIVAWGQGHGYTPNGPTVFQGPIPAFPRPASLLSGGKFYERSKPQYGSIPVSQFLSVRSAGAKGDGVTDDTAAIIIAIIDAAFSNKIVFFDAGTYKVTSTIYIPGGSKIVGESYSVILGAGKFFSDVTQPRPVVLVGLPFERGAVEWSDMIVSTQGATAGAILIQWNLNSPANSPSGMWDVHARIGGHAGSNLQVAQCPKSTNPVTPDKNCIANFMTMHVTQFASGLYLENVWLWTADHDIEDPGLNQITIYTGRGLYIESTAGNIWLVGTAVEHHTLYQYQFSGTQNVFMGQIQTETAYYQENPPATVPFPVNNNYNDPNFVAFCGNRINCASGWGLRVLRSQNILVYGAGLYSFFSNYSTSCIASATCQTQIFGIDEGGSVSSPGYGNPKASSVYVYNLNTIGTASMIDVAGKSVANYSDNVNVFPDTIALFRTS